MTEQPPVSEQNFDEEDVKAALTRVTQDGPGTDDLATLPPSDFVSFAEPDVEKDDDSQIPVVPVPVDEHEADE